MALKREFSTPSRASFFSNCVPVVVLHDQFLFAVRPLVYSLIIFSVFFADRLQKCTGIIMVDSFLEYFVRP